ncbi:type I-U CRISPR-associated helicase/endonuclease Cas3 [Egibacter rhizosphaerae]|uniref:Type I-U CRISPR-associated helicase/endonuclease Cas3 n=1 Tax=Egibacter rhizosphaerae TaxID=1670831 RepID=A0A411YEF7_9ACTN|nr:type I-U CRISPR-associated helicase/endonuclease Cas3 [Egibacter rhizosphaerae]QBI19644.1 type I-U CRISPR-associated helicase/endonuclease Cas3 [Egibacter rhizosphaerae]
MSSVGVEAPPFEVFYRAVHDDHAPLPWQRRLAEQAATGRWPSGIGVPTGLGKTSTLTVAVWALATQADRAPRERSAPTRVWYVVNRRLLVDAAYDLGLRLQALLADPQGAAADRPVDQRQALSAVAERLGAVGALGTEQGPLHVARFRGGAAPDGRVPDPSQPALLFATVAMYASRWLFQGYGSSRSMRPIDAALAGTDALVLLDEAHLSRPLVNLVPTVVECDAGDAGAVLPPERARPRMVTLSATGAADDLDLDADDHAHPLVRQRVHAPKALELREVRESQLEQELARATLDLVGVDDVNSVVTFVNSPARARAVADAVATQARRAAPEAEVELLTGRVRAREAERIRRRLLDPEHGIASGAQPHPAAPPLMVVATQTLEVGADLDFDALVTEATGRRALVQRLGRCNRLGARAHAPAVLCHPRQQREWPLYGTEPAELWAELDTAADEQGVIDVSPAALAATLDPPSDEPPRTGELLPAHVREWAKTSAPPPDAAPFEVFIDGFDEPARTASVLWRAHLPPAGVALAPPPLARESVEVPIGELRDTLVARELTTVRVVASDGVTTEDAAVTSLRPGDRVVLHARVGGYDPRGWNPGSTEEVLDLGLLEGAVLPLARPAVANLAPTALEDAELAAALRRLGAATADEADPDMDDAAALIVDRLRGLRPRDGVDSDEWAAFLDRVDRALRRPVDDVPRLQAPPQRSPARSAVRTDAFDELSFVADSVRLGDHHQTVAASAAAVLAAIGVAPTLVAVAREAGRWHDAGKIDARFQRWLGATEEPLAKSARRLDDVELTRAASGWPRGGRHELLSTRVLDQWLATSGAHSDDDELLLHLVASHHGHGRPTLPPVADSMPMRVAARFEGYDVSVSGDLAETDWTQPQRFQRLSERYGYWGLVLLEAAVRQADHAASGAVTVR